MDLEDTKAKWQRCRIRGWLCYSACGAGPDFSCICADNGSLRQSCSRGLQPATTLRIQKLTEIYEKSGPNQQKRFPTPVRSSLVRMNCRFTEKKSGDSAARRNLYYGSEGDSHSRRNA